MPKGAKRPRLGPILSPRRYAARLSRSHADLNENPQSSQHEVLMQEDTLVRPDFTDNLWHVLSFLDPQAICGARRVCKTWRQILDGTSRESEHWQSFMSAMLPFEMLGPETCCELLFFSKVLRSEALAQRCFDTLLLQFHQGAPQHTDPSPHIATFVHAHAFGAEPFCCRHTPLAAYSLAPPCASRGAVFDQNAAWSMLHASTLERLLCRDDLICPSEEEVFEGLLRWSEGQTRHAPPSSCRPVSRCSLPPLVPAN